MMDKGQKAVVWFDEVTKKDIPLVGGKGANLGEMTNAGIPVPGGFIVTATAYYDFIEKTGLQKKIKALLEPVDVHNSRQLQDTAIEVQKLIQDARMPAETAKAIEEANVKMGKGLVAVRSSATAEDLPEASFAGQQATFLNVEGEKDVVRAVQDCWASLFGARAIFYRQEQGFDHFRVGIAVPVQHMVQSEAAGVMFTVEPTTSDRTS
jgi:pyruvate,water dikinase